MFLGTGLFAQSEKPATPVGNDSFLQVITPLNEKAAKVNAAYSQVLVAATGSRSVYVTATAALNEACNTYIAELQKLQASNPYNTDLRVAAAREEATVKKIQTDYCPAGK
jgi:hypothetical protein